MGRESCDELWVRGHGSQPNGSVEHAPPVNASCPRREEQCTGNLMEGPTKTCNDSGLKHDLDSWGRPSKAPCVPHDLKRAAEPGDNDAPLRSRCSRVALQSCSQAAAPPARPRCSRVALQLERGLNLPPLPRRRRRRTAPSSFSCPSTSPSPSSPPPGACASSRSQRASC